MSEPKTRKIRIVLSIGLTCGHREVLIDLPSGWDSWSQVAQQDYLAGQAYVFKQTHLEYGASVVEE